MYGWGSCSALATCGADGRHYPIAIRRAVNYERAPCGEIKRSDGKSRMARKPKLAFDEDQLSKGQARKLTALRKSLGDDIANKAFGEWLASEPAPVEAGDKNAELIAELLVDQINQGKLRILHGGYLVRRGRGRVIVESAAD